MENVIKEKIIELLLSTEREGIDKLIKHMEDNGFFTAPCSGQYHLSKEGGLAEHSLNVYLVTKAVANDLEETEMIFNDNFWNSTKIVSLLHDLGKMGQFGKPNYVPNVLKSGKVSESKPFETNKELLTVPHEIRSIQIATQFIALTEEENFAILYHNGMYSDLKYQLNGKERPLQMLLHFADMWVSRVTEVEKS